MTAADYADDETMRSVLATARLWFVVGLSANERRPAYGVAGLLRSKGCTVVPINLRAEGAHGAVGYPTIAAAAAAHGAPDVVDVFVNSARAGDIADQAVDAGAGTVWFQIGVIDESAAQRVAAAGVRVVMDRCPAREWPRLGPSDRE
jgi:predicted CoA-binding protein